MKNYILLSFIMILGFNQIGLSQTKKIDNTDLKNKSFEELYKKIEPKEMDANVFKLLTEDWSVITSGNENDYNSMIGSWGGFGILFNKPVSWIFLNGARHTLEKVREHQTFTLSYMGEQYKEQKNILGTKSGKDTDKMKTVDLNAVKTPSGNMAFKEAYIIIELDVESMAEMNPEHFKSKESKETLIRLKGNNKEYHSMIMGVIKNVWIRR